MSVRRDLVEWFTEPVVRITANVALGASAATLIIGVPKLWSPEGAGWAAAIGTVFAGVVALRVGLAPYRHTRRAAEAQAAAHCQLAERTLLIQQTHLMAALRLMVPGTISGRERSEMQRNLDRIDSSQLRCLLPYLGVLEESLAEAITACIVDVDTGVATALSMSGAGSLDPYGFDQQLADVYLSMEDLRGRLSVVVYGTEADRIVPEARQVSAARLRHSRRE